MTPLDAVLAALVVGAALLALYLWKTLRGERSKLAETAAERDRALTAADAATTGAKTIEDRYRDLIDADAERDRIRAESVQMRADMQREAVELRERIERAHTRLQAQIDHETRQADTTRTTNSAEKAAAEARIAELRAEIAELSEVAHLQDFGFYEPRFEFATSDLYRERLDYLRAQQKAMVKGGQAAVCTTEWSVHGSRAKGIKQTNEYLRLMIRAFNGESDAAVARVRYNNVGVMEARIRKAFETINKLGLSQTASLQGAYLEAKVDELHLAYEYYEKRQREAEEQRQIREQMREEEIARREIEKAEKEAARDEDRFEKALQQARQEAEAATGAKHDKLAAQIVLLEQRLAEAHEKKERAISRAQMTRSGHVYVISNVGSFGEHVYKIGMTRRLDPMDRVMELGDASVPFRFDVHAVIYSDDAPGLEAKLHRVFHHRRVNLVNERKEFFRVEIGEIQREVLDNHGEFEFSLAATAEEYNKSLALLRDRTPPTGDGDNAVVDALATAEPPLA